MSKVEPSTCKRKSRMWLMRTPAETIPYPYEVSMETSHVAFCCDFQLMDPADELRRLGN